VIATRGGGVSRIARGRAAVVLAIASFATCAVPALAQQFGAPPPAANPPPSAALGNDLDRLTRDLGQEEAALAAEVAGIGPKLELVRHRMVARSRAYYREVRAGLLPAGAGFDALVDHAARVERMRRAIERDVAEESALLKRSSEAQGQLLKVRAERAPLELQREAMTRARTALAEADERRAAFSRAFETSVRPERSMAIYGADTGPSDGEARGGFRALKGRLPFPIAGRAEIHKLKANQQGGPAVELTAANGAAVRSVAAGRVAFADRYDDYGLTVIVDHGDHYYSVYANLGALDVHAGDSVTPGGRVGTVGGERGNAMHFELRHNANAIEPSTWLGL
jgi:septal ring factor EnvC (AmiA/AmiB activator)